MKHWYEVKGVFLAQTADKYVLETQEYWLSRSGSWNQFNDKAKRFDYFEAEYAMALAADLWQPGELKSITFYRVES